jgi:hypothetical protein
MARQEVVRSVSFFAEPGRVQGALLQLHARDQRIGKIIRFAPA